MKPDHLFEQEKQFKSLFMHELLCCLGINIINK
jgi:hypothetical protein